MSGLGRQVTGRFTFCVPGAGGRYKSLRSWLDRRYLPLGVEWLSPAAMICRLSMPQERAA